MSVDAPPRSATTPPSPKPPSWRHRLAEKGIDRTVVLLIPAAIFVVLLFLYPFFYGLGLSFQPLEGGSPVSNYKTFFTDSYLRESIWYTLRLAVPAALLNVLVSIPVAYRLRGRFRGKRLMTIILVIPITLGTVLVAEGLLNFLGPNGWLNRVLRTVNLVDHSLKLTYNFWGVFLSLVITGFPFAFLLVQAYLSGIDPTLERAAATLGAKPWQRFRWIMLPLLVPGLATTFCLTFVLAFAVFPSAVLVGDPTGSTRVLSIVAYKAAYEQYDYSLASTVAMIMGVIELVVVGIVLLWQSSFYRGTTGGKG